MNLNKQTFLRIAEVLQKTGRKPCLEKAKSLSESTQKSKHLNLRSLGLMPHEISPLVSIFKEMNHQDHTEIDSISFSYNHTLGDEGAISIVHSLPLSIRELGLVDCGIGDRGGRALLNWMSNASRLTMVCAEQNEFSESLKLDFIKFRNENPNILVIV